MYIIKQTNELFYFYFCNFLGKQIEDKRKLRGRQREREAQEWCILCQRWCGEDRNRWCGAREVFGPIRWRFAPIIGCSISLAVCSRTVSAIPAIRHPFFFFGYDHSHPAITQRLEREIYLIIIIVWVNCKLHSWNLELIGFYTPKFQKLDFTPWSLVPLAIYPLRLVFAIKWHIIMLMCFILANSALKLRRFNDKQVKSWTI